MDYQYGFEKLEVWQDARKFVSEIYLITGQFPSEEKYALTSQICRAAVSIVSNIAEGVSRKTSKEKLRFLEIAYGSLMEVYCQLNIALDLKYVTTEQFEMLKSTTTMISNKLNALSRAFERLNN
ncbi:MAG: four helix bundle protein [Tannerella sp.]|jgi:four helix bundle protein|nr:four helix bundle protein [Tannerella sp.]